MTSSTAPGERNLQALLSSLTTTVHPDTFVFITMPDEVTSIGALPPSMDARMAFQEAEGLTIVATRASADAHGLRYSFPSRMITLNVHSSLEAVGFIARVATKLAERGIGANPVSAFFHDHLFVADGREGEVVAALKELAEEAAAAAAVAAVAVDS
jgi:hypothetical protein